MRNDLGQNTDGAKCLGDELDLEKNVWIQPYHWSTFQKPTTALFFFILFSESISQFCINNFLLKVGWGGSSHVPKILKKLLLLLYVFYGIITLPINSLYNLL